MPPTNINIVDNYVKEKPLKFPYEIKNVDPEINKKLLRDFKGERSTFIQIGPKKYFFPSKYGQYAEEIYNFKVRPDDVWVITFPRSGTTLTQEMIWQIVNDLDVTTASKIPLSVRFPFLEYSTCLNDEVKEELLKENSHIQQNTKTIESLDTHVWQTMNLTKERRFIKTHIPISLLPPNLLTSGAKVVYVARNPKDVAVSYFHLNRLMRTQGYVNDWPNYWNYFENDLQYWAPYWDHVKEGWEKRNENNYLFLFYEDLQKDIENTIEKVAAFLEKDISRDNLNKLKDHLDIKNFRNNASVNFDFLKELGVTRKGEQTFIRDGKSGNWKVMFNDDLEAQANKWIEKNLQNTDLRFPTYK